MFEEEKHMTDKEALKLALEALEWMVANDDTNEGDEPVERLGGQSWNEYNAYWIDGLNKARAVINAIKQALVNDALDKKAENARELGLDYEPDYKVTVVDDQHPNGVPLAQWGRPAPDLQAELDATNRQVEILSDALAESRREIDAPVQEPVFELQKTGWEIICDLDWIQTLPFGTKLYTTPPAQPAPVQDTDAHYKGVVEGVQKLFDDKRTQPAVPDAIIEAGESPDYRDGWNDCRQTMLEILKARTA
jgi:hypothetical protein